MKTSELQTLKELSSAVLFTYPPSLTMDGHKNLYYANGQPVSLFEILRSIAEGREKIVLLDQTIQALEGRKAPVKE